MNNVFYTTCFNPRTREGCDESVSGLLRVTTEVSIHAPVRGATLAVYDFTRKEKFQSTHP